MWKLRTVALAVMRLPWQSDGGTDDSATCTPIVVTMVAAMEAAAMVVAMVTVVVAAMMVARWCPWRHRCCNGR